MYESKLPHNTREDDLRSGLRHLRHIAKSEGHYNNRYNRWCAVKTVLFLPLFSVLICQFPLLRSNMEDSAALPSESKHSTILWIGYESRLVTP